MNRFWWYVFNQPWLPARFAPWVLGKALGAKSCRRVDRATEDDREETEP